MLLGGRQGKMEILADMPAFQPHWGPPPYRMIRGSEETVGIIRSPVRASILPAAADRREARTTSTLGDSYICTV